jgi:hypothetical protein
MILSLVEPINANRKDTVHVLVGKYVFKFNYLIDVENIFGNHIYEYKLDKVFNKNNSEIDKSVQENKILGLSDEKIQQIISESTEIVRG